MVRKSELQDAIWDEVDFENAVWTIPKERMKRSKAHNVYLSRQALDIMIALKTCAGNSRYLLPSRYDADAPMSRATFNRVTYAVVERAKKEGLPLEPFTVHDLRRTGSTLLNELGFNSDWIEKCLAHEDGRSSRGVYNKAEYEEQRRHMLQEWSDMIDAWVAGKKRVPMLIPPSMPLLGARSRLLNRARRALPDVGRLSARQSGCDRREASQASTSAKIPDDASRRESEASRKFTALFHFVDRAVGERHHLAQLLPADCSSSWLVGQPDHLAAPRVHD